MPSPMNAEDFAFVCRGPEREGCHGYKVYKLSAQATGGSRGRKKGKKYKYGITSTEVVKFNKLRVYPVGVDIDPFRHLFVVMASNIDAPLILPMEELTAPFGEEAPSPSYERARRRWIMRSLRSVTVLSCVVFLRCVLPEGIRF